MMVESGMNKGRIIICNASTSFILNLVVKPKSRLIGKMQNRLNGVIDVDLYSHYIYMACNKNVENTLAVCIYVISVTL